MLNVTNHILVHGKMAKNSIFIEYFFGPVAKRTSFFRFHKIILGKSKFQKKEFKFKIQYLLYFIKILSQLEEWISSSNRRESMKVVNERLKIKNLLQNLVKIDHFLRMPVYSQKFYKSWIKKTKMLEIQPYFLFWPFKCCEWLIWTRFACFECYSLLTHCFWGSVRDRLSLRR